MVYSQNASVRRPSRRGPAAFTNCASRGIPDCTRACSVSNDGPSVRLPEQAASTSARPRTAEKKGRPEFPPRRQRPAGGRPHVCDASHCGVSGITAKHHSIHVYVYLYRRGKRCAATSQAGSAGELCEQSRSPIDGAFCTRSASGTTAAGCQAQASANLESDSAYRFPNQPSLTTSRCFARLG
jgi:hypothetical protein